MVFEQCNEAAEGSGDVVYIYMYPIVAVLETSSAESW